MSGQQPIVESSAKACRMRREVEAVLRALRCDFSSESGGPPLVSVIAVATAMNVYPAKVRQLVASGDMPEMLVITRRFQQFRLSDLAAWAQDRWIGKDPGSNGPLRPIAEPGTGVIPDCLKKGARVG